MNIVDCAGVRVLFCASADSPAAVMMSVAAFVPPALSRPVVGRPRVRLALSVLLALVPTAGVGTGRARAQWDSLELRPPSPEAQARGGIQLMKRGRPADALPYLTVAFAAAPRLVLQPGGGS